MAKREQLVLIGNGMAGMRTLEELLKLNPEIYDITVFGAEPYGNYNRILLSPVLAGEKTLDEIMLHDEQWYLDHHIKLHKGKEVTEINRAKRVVVTKDGTTETYDRLVIATGSHPFVIPVPGNDLAGVITFRDIHDVNAMLHAAKNYHHAVVIGGGLLGLEAANGLMMQGMQVTVVHLLDTLMERQLDAAAAKLLQKSLMERGMHFMMDAQTQEILGRERVQGVRFKDGHEIQADLVVMAAGIRPNIALAKSAGLHCERGIVVNDTLQTYDPRIYAVGECVQHRTKTYGLVAPLYAMAKVCANHLVGLGFSRYTGSVTATTLKVTGISVFSLGNFNGDKSTQDIILKDPTRGMYKKLVLKDNRLQGAVMYGDASDGPWYFELMSKGEDISALRDDLIFGAAYVQPVQADTDVTVQDETGKLAVLDVQEDLPEAGEWAVSTTRTVASG